VKPVGNLHGLGVVSDDDKLRVFGKVLEQLGKSPGVGRIQSRINLVQEAEGSGLNPDHSKKKRQGSQRLLTTGKGHQILKTPPRLLDYHLNAAVQRVVRVSDLQSRAAPAEQPLEQVIKSLRHLLEALQESLRGRFVNLSYD